MMPGYTDDEETRSAVKHSGTRFVAKPFSTLELIQALEREISGS
jgi:CheY-like chemotaxis protein